PQLALHLPVIGENWEVFLNGTSIRKEIFLTTDGEIAKHRSQKGVIIDLPEELLAAENTLVFHMIANAAVFSFTYNDYGGFYLSKGYEVTNVDKFRVRRAELWACMLYSVYFFFGIYHLVLYVSGRLQRYNLSFGLFCILLAFYCILISTSLFDIF